MVSFRGLDLAEARQVQLSNRTVARNLLPVDRLLLGYVAVVSAVALARLSAFPECGWLLVANALIVTLVLLVTRADLGPLGRALRDVYPILLLIALYASLDILNGGGRVAVHDAVSYSLAALPVGLSRRRHADGRHRRDVGGAAPDLSALAGLRATVDG